MARCPNCNGCMKFPHREGDLIYFVCKLCKKAYKTYRVSNTDSLEEITGDLLTKIISKINIKEID